MCLADRRASRGQGQRGATRVVCCWLCAAGTHTRTTRTIVEQRLPAVGALHGGLATGRAAPRGVGQPARQAHVVVAWAVCVCVTGCWCCQAHIMLCAVWVGTGSAKGCVGFRRAARGGCDSSCVSERCVVEWLCCWLLRVAVLLALTGCTENRTEETCTPLTPLTRVIALTGPRRQDDLDLLFAAASSALPSPCLHHHHTQLVA